MCLEGWTLRYFHRIPRLIRRTVFHVIQIYLDWGNERETSRPKYNVKVLPPQTPQSAKICAQRLNWGQILSKPLLVNIHYRRSP